SLTEAIHGSKPKFSKEDRSLLPHSDDPRASAPFGAGLRPSLPTENHHGYAQTVEGNLSACGPNAFPSPRRLYSETSGPLLKFPPAGENIFRRSYQNLENGGLGLLPSSISSAHDLKGPHARSVASHPAPH